MSDQPRVITVKCPHCGTSLVYSTDNPFRPFCSERCKMIDLGQWADENYKIPTPDTSSATLISEDSESDEEPH